MWKFTTVNLPSHRAIRYQIFAGGVVMSFSDMMESLKEKADFRFFFNELLANCPFSAFFWEVRCVNEKQLDDAFEFVVVESSILNNLRPNNAPFQQHFSYENWVVSFPNLGGDAQLIVPVEKTEAIHYTHLGNFVRHAPKTQHDKFWQTVGREYEKSINPSYVWLSTAGLGVHWLHIRIDSRPKYYRYQPYKNPG